MGWTIDIASLTVLMSVSLAVLLMAGLPLAFVTGGLGAFYLFLFGTPEMLNILPSRIFPFMTDYQLSAIPLFIFMAAMLERAGLIEGLFDMVYRVLGGIRGGLATAAIVASTILAATVGVVGATEVTMGMIALPAMLRRKYNPEMACGALLAGGTLGILIPPSIMAILYAVVAAQSVGELLVGSVFPGLLLSGLYIAYVTILSYIRPDFGPALPKEERITVVEKVKLMSGIFPALFLITLVLGVIFLGVATPVEAAGIGTFGAIVVTAMAGRLSWTACREAANTTLKASAMVLWITFGASIFVGFYILSGGQDFVTNMLVGTGWGAYGILFTMQIILVILGMFLDWVGILLLTVPIFVPILKSLAFSGVLGLPGVDPSDIPLWFGVVFIVNMQIAFLSPPFGYSLFYLRSVAPPEVSMATIFRGALPFIGLQIIGLAICIIFPPIVTWLPSLMYTH